MAPVFDTYPSVCVSEIMITHQPPGFPIHHYILPHKIRFFGVSSIYVSSFSIIFPHQGCHKKGDTIHPKGLAFPKAMAEEEARLKEESSASVAKAVLLKIGGFSYGFPMLSIKI